MIQGGSQQRDLLRLARLYGLQPSYSDMEGRRIEPLIIAWEGKLSGFELRLPEREAKGRIVFGTQMKDGQSGASADSGPGNRAIAFGA